MEALVHQLLEAVQGMASAFGSFEEDSGCRAQRATGAALVVDVFPVLAVIATGQEQVVSDPVVHLGGQHGRAIGVLGIAYEVVGDQHLQDRATIAAAAAIASRSPEADI